MKTQIKKLMKASMNLTLVTALFILAACGGNQEKSSSESDAPGNSETSVKPPNMDIHAATVLGDLKAIQQHIEAGTNLDQGEPTLGSSPLISAAVFGKTEIALALIEAGADVNLHNNEGSTALHSAAFLCRKEIVAMLLKNGADKDLRNNFGSTALESVAAPFEQVKVIYDQFNKDLGPLGFKLDYEYVEDTRPRIAEMLR